MFPDNYYEISEPVTGYITSYVPDYSKTVINRIAEEKAMEEAANVIDHGLADASIELHLPDFLPVDTTLIGEATLLNANPGLSGRLSWYLDGKAVLEEPVITGTYLSGFNHDFKYTRDMPETAVVKVVLEYVTNQGEKHEISDERTIKIENRSKLHWMELEAPRVLGMVTSQYQGDRTQEWALENDYDDFDKEVFVHAKGYESETDYLLWVSRSHQRLNIFIKTDDGWELFETFLVATGSPGAVTRRGVTYITSRTEEGWNFGTHRVKPVVRFFPNSPYAFHSRLLHPRTGEVIDDRIGFPASAGCVRLYCEDIRYIYDNIPDGTTVVVY